MKLILALDVGTFEKARYFINKLYPKIKIFKVGLQLFIACGPRIIEFIHKKGGRVFLDLKFNDIPNTMANAAKELLKHKVAMFTVHTLSGPTAIKEVAKVCKGSKTKVLGVTILTSICSHFLQDLKIQRRLPEEALYLARMAKRCGLNGVVCSVHEAKLIRKYLGRNFLIVSPGIRLRGKAQADQCRSATPDEAKLAGVDYIVVGRPILKANDPLKAVEEFI
jgi:orotidine-5'-phosphate decarboxylase